MYPEKVQPVIVTKIVTEADIPALTFPGWKAEKTVLETSRHCSNRDCGKVLLKGTTIIRVSRIEPKRIGMPTYVFCNIACERQAYVTQKMKWA